MNPLELALARSKAYALFEQLYLNGINSQTKKSIVQIPELADKIDNEKRFEEFAADHYAIFVHNLPPYASLFLEKTGQPGGEVTEKVMKAFRECGYKPSTTSESADHIGHILGSLSFICGAESDAWEDGRHHVAGQMRQIQVELLEGQLLPWIFPFWSAVHAHNNPFYRELANLTVNISTDHYANLKNLHSFNQTRFDDAEEPNIDEMKLHDIADYLLKPAISGCWISTNLLGDLSRQFDLPRGFGDRKTILLNLLKAAGKYNQFGPLLQVISEKFSDIHLGFEQIKNEEPTLSRFIFPWSAKICETNSLLNELKLVWEQEQAVEV